jgi:hypothetical protein
MYTLKYYKMIKYGENNVFNIYVFWWGGNQHPTLHFIIIHNVLALLKFYGHLFSVHN